MTFVIQWIWLTLSPWGPSGPAPPGSPLGPLFPSSPCGPLGPWRPGGPWKTHPMADSYSSECRGNISTSISSITDPTVETLHIHTVGRLRDKKTYKFSFRSGFSLEPWDTGVSLNTRTAREWEASKLEGKTAAAARSAASFCRWNKKSSSDDIQMFLWGREVQ